LISKLGIDEGDWPKGLTGMELERSRRLQRNKPNLT